MGRKGKRGGGVRRREKERKQKIKKVSKERKEGWRKGCHSAL